MHFVAFSFFCSVQSVYAETAQYDVPPPPNILNSKVELVEPQGLLSLEQAMSLSLLHNPMLQDFALATRVADVKTLGAGLYKNPELDIEVENFLGSGRLRRFQQTETTFSISQLFELGGKRSKRQALAETEYDLSIWNYEARRMDMIYLVAINYIKVLANQARLELATETTRLAEEIYDTVGARVKAGKVSPLEQSKSRVELANARLEQARVKRALIISKQNLAALWGSANPLFSNVTGNLFFTQKLPEFSEIQARLKNNPDLARWEAEIARYRKAISLAKAKKIPDVTVMAGARHFADQDDFAAVAGFSVPLFIFDNKQYGVDEANILLTQGLQRRQAASVEIQATFVENFQQLQMSETEIEAIKNEVLPSAKAALEAAKTAYRLGKIGSLDLLDAQRTLFRTSIQQLEALVSYHLNVARIERLIGGALNPASTN
jgi:cobalt-zinc-cadmium efflux system outer membrane protein